MTGEPDNVEGECNARLFIGDNHGDNHATMRCQLLPGHNGWHREMYKGGGGHVAVTWEKDQRGVCGVCGTTQNDDRDWCCDEHLDILIARNEATQESE